MLLYGPEWMADIKKNLTRKCADGSFRYTISPLYRRDVNAYTKEAIQGLQAMLAADGIQSDFHRDRIAQGKIPANTAYLEVRDLKSLNNLETKLRNAGIKLAPDRFLEKKEPSALLMKKRRQGGR